MNITLSSIPKPIGGGGFETNFTDYMEQMEFENASLKMELTGQQKILHANKELIDSLIDERAHDNIKSLKDQVKSQ